jgi:tetratricopeptide (TPR) repeat protein
MCKAQFLSLLLLASSWAGAVAAPTGEDAWEKAAKLQFDDAWIAFESTPAGDEIQERDRLLGEGLLLLSKQPRTEGNVEQALKIFERLKQEAPGSLPGILGAYYAARILELHLKVPDLAAAESGYRGVLASKPGHPVAEQAANRLVVLAGTGKGDASARRARLAELEALVDSLQTPSGLREFHTSMAMAILDNEGDRRKALEHLQKADALGLSLKSYSIPIWFIAGDLAAELGQRDEAARFYQKVIKNYPRDPRAFLARKRLEALMAENG